MKQLGVSKIDERNRVYIPQEVLDVLPKGDRLSWELDENDCVCVFMGHERFLRNSNKYKSENNSGGNESKKVDAS